MREPEVAEAGGGRGALGGGVHPRLGQGALRQAATSLGGAGARRIPTPSFALHPPIPRPLRPSAWLRLPRSRSPVADVWAAAPSAPVGQGRGPALAVSPLHRFL